MMGRETPGREMRASSITSVMIMAVSLSCRSRRLSQQSRGRLFILMWVPALAVALLACGTANRQQSGTENQVQAAAAPAAPEPVTPQGGSSTQTGTQTDTRPVIAAFGD